MHEEKARALVITEVGVGDGSEEEADPEANVVEPPLRKILSLFQFSQVEAGGDDV